MARLYGKRDKVTEALEVLTLIRGMLESLGGSAHLPASLDATVEDILTLPLGTQVLSKDATVVQGDLIVANDVVNLTSLAIGNDGEYLRSDGSDPSWSAIQAGDLPGDFSGFANPTASVGLTVVNGSATTAMRSDAAPPLDQGITPTWTGLHTHANDIVFQDDRWCGLGQTAGRFVFDSTPDPDQIELTQADLYVATTAHGIIHVDGNTDGYVLRADGTRYVPGQVVVADVSDLAYTTPNLTLGTANAAGAADSVIRSDATILVFDATNPTTIAVGDTAIPGAATVAARRDHTHGITTSSNPGAAASILASDASGFLQLEAIGIGVAPDGAWPIKINSTSEVLIQAVSSDDRCSIEMQDDDTTGYITVQDGEMSIGRTAGAGSVTNFNLHMTSTKAAFGIETVNSDGTFHIHTGSAGTVAADSAANELVLENTDVAGLTLLTNDAANSNIYFGSPSDNIGALVRWNHDADLMTVGTAKAGASLALTYGNVTTGITLSTDMRVTPGLVYFNETANDDMTLGLTINQSNNDDEIVAFKSNDGVTPDVNHPMTDLAEDDTYGAFRKASGAAGGLEIRGLRDSGGAAGNALTMRGFLGEEAISTKTTGTIGVVTIDAAITNGSTGKQAVGTNGNLVVMRNDTTARWILDADGDIFYGGSDDGSITDDEDDVMLLAGLRALKSPSDSPARRAFKGFLDDAEAALIKAGVLTAPLDEGGLTSRQGLDGLLIDALRQLYYRIENLEAQTYAVGA